MTLNLGMAQYKQLFVQIYKIVTDGARGSGGAWFFGRCWLYRGGKDAIESSQSAIIPFDDCDRLLDCIKCKFFGRNNMFMRGFVPNIYYFEE